jgi:hypothetical protein
MNLAEGLQLRGAASLDFLGEVEEHRKYPRVSWRWVR